MRHREPFTRDNARGWYLEVIKALEGFEPENEEWVTFGEIMRAVRTYGLSNMLAQSLRRHEVIECQELPLRIGYNLPRYLYPLKRYKKAAAVYAEWAKKQNNKLTG